MGFIFNKVIKPLFRTQKGNWKSRLTEQLDKQIVICKDMNASSIAMTLDNMVNQIYYYDKLLLKVAAQYKKFNLETSKPIHKLALKYPEQLSEKDILRFFDETWLIVRTMQRESEPEIINLANIGSFGIIVMSIGIVYFKDSRTKGFQVWKELERGFSETKKFNYKKHLPEELTKLLETAVFN